LTLVWAVRGLEGADAADEVFAGSDAEFVEDVPEVEFDGFNADVQLGGGLPVRAAGGDQAGHCLLGRCKAGQGGGGCGSGGRASGGEFPVTGLQVGPGAQRDQAFPGGAQPGDCGS
jgi:hypothetical protein